MTEIEGYTNLEIIGRGGFAVVYKARQVSVGRDVAIKLLTDPAPDDDLVRRFKRESQAVGALSWHPHIAAVVDAGSTAAGQAYIVFELLQGGSLEDRLADAPLPWNEAVSSMIQVADAVEAAHRADVLHRDIKPANILLDRLGVAKLGDFGIASMQDGNKTETGMLATTVAHAAPELFDGHPASPATDIYALGSTLHTLVTGSAPFAPSAGERIGSVIARIASEPPPRPDPNAVPDQVATIIAHALAKQAQYRPRSAAAFGQALQHAQQELGRRVTAMPVTDTEPSAPAVITPPPRSDGGAGATREQTVGPSGGPTPAPTAQSPPASPSPSAVPDHSATRNVPFVPPASQSEGTAKPFTRTIAALTAIAVLLAAGVAGLVLWQMRSGPSVVATTPGGARIVSFDALAVTEMDPPFDAASAVDGDMSTAWGIQPGANGTPIIGTSYVVTLAEEQTIVGVGIANDPESSLGRASKILWGTTIADLEDGGPDVLEQELPDAPGTHTEPFSIVTSQIVLAIVGTHGDPDQIGIAEIVINVEPDRG